MRKMISIIFIVLFVIGCKSDSQSCQNKRIYLNKLRIHAAQIKSIWEEKCNNENYTYTDAQKLLCDKINERYNIALNKVTINQKNFRGTNCKKTKLYICDEKLENLTILIQSLSEKESHYTNQIQELQVQQKPHIGKIQGVLFLNILNSPTLKMSLEIIRKADSYIQVFSQARQQVKKAKQETWRVHNLTALDCITLRSTGNDAQFANLLEQIDNVIKNYQPQADKLITSDNITPSASLEETWKKYQ